MRTPGHDFELAAGWMVNEGLASPTSLGRIAYCTDADLTPDQEFNVVTVTVTAGTPIPHRHSGAGSSACGVCGKDSVAEALSVTSGPAWSGARPGRGRRTTPAGGPARAPDPLRQDGRRACCRAR